MKSDFSKANNNLGKVLFVTRKYPPVKGGLESYSYNLISNYKEPHKAIVLRKKQSNLIWFLPYCLVYVLLNISKYDVIELGDLLLCCVGWLGKKIKPDVKVVVTVHGLDITYKNKIYQRYLKIFLGNFDMYVPNSTYTKEVAENLGYASCQVIFPATLSGIPMRKDNMCSADTFRQRYNIPDDTMILTTIGRLVERKGVEWFIRNVLCRLQDSNICYLVVGKGIMKEKIEETIAECNEHRVRMLGEVTDLEIEEIYHYTDIFLMPNIRVEGDVEGYGMVAVEAAAAGCLVIAARIQGIIDAVQDGVSGILYEAENADELIGIIEDAVKNYDEYIQHFQPSSIKYVLSECTGNAIANKYKELFVHL